MKNYLKLVNFEINRFFKIYIALAVITIISQLVGVYVLSKQYINRAYDLMAEHSLTVDQFIYDWGEMSFYNITQTLWFMGPIALCIVSLLFYIFLIWYRDWYGKNTFIYRLLMLPTNRLNVFLGKATAILLMTVGFISLQILLLPIESQILKWTVPIEFRMDMSIREILYTFNYLMILFPNTFTDFVIHYGIGFLAVIVLFTAILFERCFRIKGIVFGVLYCGFVYVLLRLPLIITIVKEKTFLYPIEYFWVEVFLGIIVITLSLWISHYLLKRKITV